MEIQKEEDENMNKFKLYQINELGKLEKNSITQTLLVISITIHAM